ncbi:MAG: Rod shape-determining protein MreD, partial [Pseudomonadota bacterium]|nr:Rod shape-determining protein MreD [Pseudomonadota bacterium]
MAAGGQFPGFLYFLWPVVGTLLWVPLTFVLLLPQ